MMWWSAAASNKACVSGQRVMWTHLELHGHVAKDWRPGPNTGLPGITPKTLLQVLDSLSHLANGYSSRVLTLTNSTL